MITAAWVQVELGPVRRGRARVLEGWTSRLPTPSVCGLVGLNGAGKSSLMLALGGALRHRAAAAETTRREAGGRVARATLALATQHPHLPPWMTLEEICGLHELPAMELAERFPGLLLEELAGRRAAMYSGGQAQALSVALALGADADLTLLDEPLTALDVRRRRGLLDVLRARRTQRGGGAVLLSSQVAADLHESCDRLVVLAEGRVVFDGTTTALLGGHGAGNGLARGPAGLEARLMALACGPLDPPSLARQ